MITIYDPVSKRDVSIRLVGNQATMCCGTKWITETIRPADISMARLALSKRDLESFGSFFNEPKAERRAA